MIDVIPTIAITEDDATLRSNESKTYRMDPINKRIQGGTDGIDALRQAVSKILMTERQSYLIYGVDYGIEAERLIGKDMDFVKADIERTVKDALLQDNRIIEILNFAYEKNGDTLAVSFFINSIYGGLKIESEVRV